MCARARVRAQSIKRVKSSPYTYGHTDECTMIDLDILIDRILNQVSCDEAQEAISARARERLRASEIVTKLPGGVPQRTPEWYRVRRGMITASEFKIAGATNACDSYIWGKIFPQPFPSNAAMQWGCRFEDLAAATYEFENASKIHEYGLLIHPKDTWLGASPDGITAYGVAIEIKVPYSRKRVEINRRVEEDRPFPKSDRANLYARYSPQVQGQLEVCDLDACDFVVAHIDALDEPTFWQLRRVSEQPYRYAIVADVANVDTGTLAYKTSPLASDDAALLVWQKECSEMPGFVVFHHVHMRELGVTRIRRDRETWSRLRANLGRTKDAIENIKSRAKAVEIPQGCSVPMFSGDIDDVPETNTGVCGQKATVKVERAASAGARPSVPKRPTVCSDAPMFVDDI